MGDDTSTDTRPRAMVGLMADPGLPLALAKKLASSLPEIFEKKIDDSVQWHVEAENYSLPLSNEGSVELTRSSSTVRQERGWDYMVYLTDLPKYILKEPMVATRNSSYGAGMIVVPALGLRGAGPVRRLLLPMISALHVDSADQEPKGSPLSVLDRIATIDDGIEESDSQATVETSKGLPGRLSLLAGMVRSNTPLKLLPSLSSAMAAAIGTAAFGIFYASIWSMADYLVPARLLLISVLSVTILTVWLIASHGLWEKPEGTHLRERRFIYNAATATTVVVAVAAMYAALFIVVLIGALVVIDVGFLEENLRNEAGFLDYVNLSWLSTSMGTIGGAVGSSMSNAEEVRRATFSNREYQRRQLSLVKEEQAEQEQEQGEME